MKFNDLRKILFLTTLLFLVMEGVFAQSDISSPYSRFGIGTLQTTTNMELQGMAGIGNAMYGGSMLNNANPASYAAIDSLSFLFDAGFYIKNATYRNSKSSENGANASFDYVCLGFCLTKWWKMGLGVNPFSTKYYESLLSYSDPTNYNVQYLGEGGLTECYWSNGFKIGKNLFLGANGSFIFGTMGDESTVYFPDSDNYTQGRRTIYNEFHNFKCDFGAIYTIDLKNENSLVFGATYTPQVNFKIGRETFIRSITSYSSTVEVPIDTLKYTTDDNVKVTYPQGFGFGATFKRGDRLTIGVDFNWDNWKKFSIGGVSDSLQNSWNVAIGGSYKPKSTKISSYFTKMTYRAGLFYGHTYYNIYGESLNKMGVTIGLGLPLPKSLSSFNIAFEFGSMGKTDKNLVQETYFNISIGMSIHETWFVKRKYR